MQNLDTLLLPMKYQAIAVQDSRALWHRAVILDTIEKGTFLFNSLFKSAFAISCCLYNVCTINGNKRSICKLDDKVIKLMVNIVNCKVCSKQDQICDNVEIDNPNDGYYIITQIRIPAEFYGLSQNHRREFEVLCKELEQYYNNSVHDQSLTVPVISENIPYRENGSKLLVKLIDSGDEIVVDKSELLRINSKFCTIPAVVQKFYLHGYDGLQSSVNIARNLKQLLRNQVVHIKIQGLMLNGHYAVDVTLCDSRSINKMLLSN